MPAANYNITVDQYSDFSRSLQIKVANTVLDITGYTFAASLREKIQSTTAYNFSTAIVDAGEGVVNFSMTAAQTGAVPAGDYVWDLVMTDDSGFKTRLLQGQARVSGGVTR